MLIINERNKTLYIRSDVHLLKTLYLQLEERPPRSVRRFDPSHRRSRSQNERMGHATLNRRTPRFGETGQLQIHENSGRGVDPKMHESLGFTNRTPTNRFAPSELDPKGRPSL